MWKETAKRNAHKDSMELVNEANKNVDGTVKDISKKWKHRSRLSIL